MDWDGWEMTWNGRRRQRDTLGREGYRLGQERYTLEPKNTVRVLIGFCLMIHGSSPSFVLRRSCKVDMMDAMKGIFVDNSNDN